MFQHIGMLTLADTATAEQKAALVKALEDLATQVPGLRSADVGLDAGLSVGNANLYFRMEFDTQQEWEAYRSNPAHVAVITDHIAPILVSKVFVQRA